MPPPPPQNPPDDQPRGGPTPPITDEQRGIAAKNRGIGEPGTKGKGLEEQGTKRKGTEYRGIAKKPAPTPKGRSLHAPAKVEFPDTIVGEGPTIDIYVVNLNPRYAATITANVVGASEFVVRAKPEHLRPAHERVTKPIVVGFFPRARSEVNAQLRIHATWQMGAVPPEEITIELRGKAHMDGEPTHAEAAEAARRQKALAEATARDSKAAADLKKEFEDYTKRDGPPPHRGQEAAFGSLYREAVRQMNFIVREQIGGIGLAAREAGAFVRERRPPARSVAWAIAIGAVDLATAGIAGVVAGAIKRKVEEEPTWTSPPRPRVRTSQKTIEPTEPTLDFVADSVKALIRQTARDVLNEAAKDFKEEGGQAAIYFFDMQDRLISKQAAARETKLNVVFNGYLPQLHKNGTATLATFRHVVDAITLGVEHARDLQAHQGRMSWMRFLAQGALGSADAPPGSGLEKVTNVRGATATAPERGRVALIDGVVDVEIAADYNAPKTPVKVVAVRCGGITRSSFEELLKENQHRLRGLSVVVRATGKAKGVAEFKVCVVQNESGEIEFVDNTGASGTQSTWLTRKAAGTGTARQHTGARKLMDEVLDSVLSASLLETDEA